MQSLEKKEEEEEKGPKSRSTMEGEPVREGFRRVKNLDLRALSCASPSTILAPRLAGCE